MIDDGRATILLDRESTDGHLGLVHDVIPAGHAGPPLHWHPDFDECFYVLEGGLVFRLRDEVFTVHPGETALARRGVAHTFANPSARDTRVLLLVTPAGFERHFARRAGEAGPANDETIVIGGRLSASAIAAAGSRRRQPTAVTLQGQSDALPQAHR